MYLNIKSIMLLLACLTGLAATAKDHTVDVEVAYGLNHDPALKAKVEHNASAIITALNRAADLGEGVNYTGIDITTEAKAALNNLLIGKKIAYASFDDDFNTPVSEKVARNQFGEYELRNIPVLFIDSENPDDANYEEIGITFSPKGVIENVYITIEREQYNKILKGMTEVKDESNRLAILSWMEALATAYHEKDLNWFKTFLSDDVLVVTGSRKYTPNGETFTYTEYDKAGYLQKLDRCFKVNPVIEVKFNDITVMGHALDDKGRYYAVECVQSWSATHYSDVGRLFVVWDFGHPSGPQILFRGWTEMDDPKKFSIYEMPLLLEK